MTTHPIVVGIILAICGASLGFNTSQILIVGDVKSTAQDVSHLREENGDIKATEAKDVSTLTTLFTKNLDQNRELIDLVKVQNELLTRKK